MLVLSCSPAWKFHFASRILQYHTDDRQGTHESRCGYLWQILEHCRSSPTIYVFCISIYVSYTSPRLLVFVSLCVDPLDWLHHTWNIWKICPKGSAWVPYLVNTGSCWYGRWVPRNWPCDHGGTFTIKFPCPGKTKPCMREGLGQTLISNCGLFHDFFLFSIVWG